MPYKIRKKKSDGYSVRGPSGVHAKNTTKEKAESQVRLLNAIEHGFEPDEDRITRHKKKNKM